TPTPSPTSTPTSTPTPTPPAPADGTELFDTAKDGSDTSTSESTGATGVTDTSGTTQPETAFPHLAIVGVDYELINWVKEPGQYHMVGTYFRIKLTFKITNKGEADFPPEGVTANLGNGGRLFWTILYDGKQSEDTMTNMYPFYSFWYHNELNIPAGGIGFVEREFRVAFDRPLNPFTVVAWFAPPLTEESEIPAADAPVIQQTVPIPGGNKIALQLDQAPYVSEAFILEGPDIKPLIISVSEVKGKPGLYNIIAIFENLNPVETAGSVQVTIMVPDKSKPNSYSLSDVSFNWFREISGPFVMGRHGIYLENQRVRGEPYWEKTYFHTVLLCPDPDATSGEISIGDIDRTNDLRYMKDVWKESLTDLLLSLKTKYYEDG
nr:hypothetical protein [Nitrososphaeria archaeon]